MYSGAGSTTNRGGCIQEWLVVQLIEVDITMRGWQYYNISMWMYSGVASSTTYRGGSIQERLVVQLIEVDVFGRQHSGEGSSTTYRGGCIQERLVVQLIEVDVFRSG